MKVDDLNALKKKAVNKKNGVYMLWEGNHPCFYDCDIQVNLNN